MKRRLAALTLAATCALSAGACSDPNSPVGDHQPTRGEVDKRDAHLYAGGAIAFYYLLIDTNYGDFWVEEDWEDWLGCRPGDAWARALGCL